MASEYTSHYNLDLYADSDKPNLRDQYNGAMNKIDQQLYTQSVDTTTANSNANNAVSAAAAASKAAADEATRAKAAEGTISSTANAANAAATAASKAAADEATRAMAAESDITNAYKAADSTLAAHFPIRTADIAAGAVTRDKLDAQALSSLITGITIRRFDSNDSNADNAGMVVPDGGHLAGFYLPELTMLVLAHFESSAGHDIGSFLATGQDAAVEFKLPSYVPNTTAGSIKLNAVGVCYNSTSDFVCFTGVGITKDGHVGVNTKIHSTDNKALAMAGNAVVFLRAFGVA